MEKYIEKEEITQKQAIALNLNEVRDMCFFNAKEAGWHSTIGQDNIAKYVKGTQIALIHSEVSEALEAERKGLMDDKLKNRPGAEVELADAIIRIMDYCGRWGYDIGGAVVEKLEYNKVRLDHKPENRAKDGGKKF